MDTLYSFLFFAALIGIAFIWRKATSSASKAINQKVLFRAEHKEGQELVSQPLVYETTASVEEVMAELDARVTKSENRPGILATVYELNRDKNHIIYALGNAVFPKMVVAGVTLGAEGDKTKCEYQVLQWRESDGLVADQEIIKQLRKQVKASFKAADSKSSQAVGRTNTIGNETKTIVTSVSTDAVRSIESRVNITEPTVVSAATVKSADSPLKYCSQCGARNKHSSNFCSQCGAGI